MKTITLALIVVLHTTGLWTHISKDDRTRLINASTNVKTAAPSAPAPVAILPPPIRVSDASLDLPATAVIATDVASGTILYAKNSGAHRPIASVTKLITALVILSRHSPDELVTVPKLPAYPQEAETIGFIPGDTMRLRDVLEAALVPSANDAADTLAIWDSGSVTKFAAKMNAKMSEWGITDTHFASASGLEDTNNYTTAAALAKIATLAVANPTLKTIVSHTGGTITSGQNRVYTFKTTNELLASGQFYGIKTGYTQAAGECFVGLTRINGHEVVTVVLDAGNRFGATTTLTNWIGQTWQWL